MLLPPLILLLLQPLSAVTEDVDSKCSYCLAVSKVKSLLSLNTRGQSLRVCTAASQFCLLGHWKAAAAAGVGGSGPEREAQVYRAFDLAVGHLRGWPTQSFEAVFGVGTL